MVTVLNTIWKYFREMVSHVRPIRNARPAISKTKIVPPIAPAQSELDADREKIGFTVDVAMRLAAEREGDDDVNGSVTILEPKAMKLQDLADTA